MSKANERFFGVWINGTSVSAGYMPVDNDGPATPNASEAQRFSTAEQAANEIARRRWDNDTSVRPGRTTAYVVELIPTILVSRVAS